VGWLTPQAAKDVLGEDLTGTLDEESFQEAVDAAAGYVADNRTDLLVEDVFTPTPQLRFGTALLALRWYSRRRATTSNADEGAVADVISDDPDLGRMLGIGLRGRPVFGAPTVVEVV
jgi:hypothetical protein